MFPPKKSIAIDVVAPVDHMDHTPAPTEKPDMEVQAKLDAMDQMLDDIRTALGMKMNKKEEASEPSAPTEGV